jgi:adenylylsulfate kinase
LPASGKSSLAWELTALLEKRGLSAQVLDSDRLRQVLTPEPTYSQSEREWFYQVLVYIAGLLAKNGVNVIIAATGNRRHHRVQAREVIDKFMVVYLQCSLETCIARDPKGIYAAAMRGKAQTVPGLQSPYEAPQSPELTVDSELRSPQDGAQKILHEILGRYYRESDKGGN